MVENRSLIGEEVVDKKKSGSFQERFGKKGSGRDV